MHDAGVLHERPAQPLLHAVLFLGIIFFGEVQKSREDDPQHAKSKARQDEADKLNRYECFDWGTLDEWSNVTAHNPTATRVGGRMLLSSTFEELEEIFRELKGRFIMQGYKQLDKDGKNIVKTWKSDNPELLSLPLQQHELRMLLSGGIKAGGKRTKTASGSQKYPSLP